MLTSYLGTKVIGQIEKLSIGITGKLKDMETNWEFGICTALKAYRLSEHL